MPYITPNLKAYEEKVTSQFAEDGVLVHIAQCLGIVKGTYFEFGIGPSVAGRFQDGLEGNFVHLATLGWTGVFLDGGIYPPELGVRQAYITALNINEIYRRHAVPDDLDFMSIDVDGQEFWIWMALQPRPKLMIIEYNGGLGKDLSATIQFDTAHVWDGTIYHGASLRALDKLARTKGYVLVYANGVNGVFLRGDLVSNPEDFVYDALWAGYPGHLPDPKSRPFVVI